MKNKILAVILLLQFVTVGLLAQSSVFEGSWTIVNAEINLQSNGQSELLATVDKEKFEEQLIPETIRFDGDSLELKMGDKIYRSAYFYGSGRLEFEVNGDLKIYTAWQSGNNEFVLMRNYDHAADNSYKELRIKYKK